MTTTSATAGLGACIALGTWVGVLAGRWLHRRAGASPPRANVIACRRRHSGSPRQDSTNGGRRRPRPLQSSVRPRFDMATTSNPATPKVLQEPISVSSDVLARLGEELITNHIQALAELIKNSYDADATRVRVTIDTERLIEDEEGQVRKGIITVEDDGFGMDEDAVRNGWLRVSASRKREMKARGEPLPGAALRSETRAWDASGRNGSATMSASARARSRVSIRAAMALPRSSTTSPSIFRTSRPSSTSAGSGCRGRSTPCRGIKRARSHGRAQRRRERCWKSPTFAMPKIGPITPSSSAR